MLNSISWQQYLTAVLLISIAWYGFVVMKYYRAEIATFLKFAPKQAGALPAVANSKTPVIGEIKNAPGETTFEPHEIMFADNDVSDEISDQTLPKGPADDLLAEAETLVHAFQETNNKPEFLSLLRVLIEKYEVFADEISLPALMNTLKKFSDKLPFRVKDTEWPLNF